MRLAIYQRDGERELNRRRKTLVTTEKQSSARQMTILPRELLYTSLALHRSVCLYQILGSWQFVSIVTGCGLILVVSGGPDTAGISPNFVSFSIFTQFSAGLCPDRHRRTGSKTISISTMPSILSFNIVMTDQQNWASSSI